MPLLKSHVEQYGVRVTTSLQSLPVQAGSQLLASRQPAHRYANSIASLRAVPDTARKPLTWPRGASREQHQSQHRWQSLHLARRRATNATANSTANASRRTSAR